MWTFLREHNLPPESPSSLWCTLQIASRQIIWFYAADIHSTPTAHYKLDTTNYFQALSTIQDGGHVKIPLPGDITYDQNSYPGDRHYSQNPVGSPTPSPSGLTLVGALSGRALCRQTILCKLAVGKLNLPSAHFIRNFTPWFVLRWLNTVFCSHPGCCDQHAHKDNKKKTWHW